METLLLRLTIFSFYCTSNCILNGSAWGTSMIALKSLFLKH